MGHLKIKKVKNQEVINWFKDRYLQGIIIQV